jgi:hypothetical protein
LFFGRCGTELDGEEVNFGWFGWPGIVWGVDGNCPTRSRGVPFIASWRKGEEMATCSGVDGNIGMGEICGVDAQWKCVLLLGTLERRKQNRQANRASTTKTAVLCSTTQHI